jgi:hypothetical protein
LIPLSINKRLYLSKSKEVKRKLIYYFLLERKQISLWIWPPAPKKEKKIQKEENSRQTKQTKAYNRKQKEVIPEHN